MRNGSLFIKLVSIRTGISVFLFNMTMLLQSNQIADFSFEFPFNIIATGIILR